MNVIFVCRLDPAFRSVLDGATTLGHLRAGLEKQALSERIDKVTGL